MCWNRLQFHVLGRVERFAVIPRVFGTRDGPKIAFGVAHDPALRASPGPRICPLSVSPWLPCSFTSLEFLLVIRQHKIAGTLGGQWQKRHKECAIFLSADALLANGDLYIIWLLISQSSL